MISLLDNFGISAGKLVLDLHDCCNGCHGCLQLSTASMESKQLKGHGLKAYNCHDNHCRNCNNLHKTSLDSYLDNFKSFSYNCGVNIEVEVHCLKICSIHLCVKWYSPPYPHHCHPHPHRPHLAYALPEVPALHAAKPPGDCFQRNPEL